jgi:hypothetical protein
MQGRKINHCLNNVIKFSLMSTNDVKLTIIFVPILVKVIKDLLLLFRKGG